MYLFLLAFKQVMIIVLIARDLRVILNSISGVKYNIVVRFPIGHVYNKVKDKHILLNFINSYISLGSFISLKRKLCLIGMKQPFFSKRKFISSNQEAMCIWVYIFFKKFKISKLKNNNTLFAIFSQLFVIEFIN